MDNTIHTEEKLQLFRNIESLMDNIFFDTNNEGMWEFAIKSLQEILDTGMAEYKRLIGTNVSYSHRMRGEQGRYQTRTGKIIGVFSFDCGNPKMQIEYAPGM